LSEPEISIEKKHLNQTQKLSERVNALWMRVAPTERQRLFVLTLISGALCGLAAVAFHLGMDKASTLLIDRAMAAPQNSWMWWTILTPTIGGVVVGLGLRYWVPGAVGSGIPQVKTAYALNAGRVPFRDAFGKFVLGIIQVGSGGSLGREGPTVQVCAGVSNLLARAAKLSRQSQRRMASVGVAAGIAAAFNAPIAAVTFTVEEVVGDLDQTVLTGIIVAAAIAAAVERGVLGQQPVFQVTKQYAQGPASSLVSYAVLGVLAAVVAVTFTDSLLKLRSGFKKFTAVPPWVHPGIGGAMTGTLAVIAMMWLRQGGVTGSGYGTLNKALDGSLPLQALMALCVLKLAATVWSYASGGAGGIFAPALFIGGMLGGAVGTLDMMLFHHGPDTVAAFALVGMGAVFAGIIRAPITSVLIIFEMTGSYGLILPLMIANMSAYALARHWRKTPIYEALLEQDGVVLPHGKATMPENPATVVTGEKLP